MQLRGKRCSVWLHPGLSLGVPPNKQQPGLSRYGEMGFRSHHPVALL